VAAATTDLRAVAAFTERLGKDIEHTVQETRAIVNRVSTGVQRTSRWLHAGLGFFEGGYRQAFAVGAGVGNGVRELFGRARRHEVASRLPAVLEDTPRMPARLGAGS
jgi:hypothetical protein